MEQLGWLKALQSRRQRMFFDDALGFGIRTGITVPIAGGLGRSAAFTLASDEADPALPRLWEQGRELLQTMGLAYHVHADVKLGASRVLPMTPSCHNGNANAFAWASRGKTMMETGAILGISERGVKHHLHNARLKLRAATLPQAVAIGIRNGSLR